MTAKGPPETCLHFTRRNITSCPSPPPLPLLPTHSLPLPPTHSSPYASNAPYTPLGAAFRGRGEVTLPSLVLAAAGLLNPRICCERSPLPFVSPMPSYSFLPTSLLLIGLLFVTFLALFFNLFLLHFQLSFFFLSLSPSYVRSPLHRCFSFSSLLSSSSQLPPSPIPPLLPPIP